MRLRSLFLFLPLFLSTLCAKAQHNYLYEPTQYCEGSIGTQNVRILFQNMYGSLEGFLFDDQHPSPMMLRAWEESGDSLTFYAYYDETGDFYQQAGTDSSSFLTGKLRVHFSGRGLKGFWTGTDGRRIPLDCSLIEQATPSPEELKKFLEEGNLETRVTTLSRWLCGTSPGVHCVAPLPYVGTSYFAEDGETSVAIQYEQLFGDEKKEALLQVNVGNYKTQVFVLIPTAQGWQPWSEFLHLETMQGFTSCLYCADQREYSRIQTFRGCGGNWFLEAMNCGGECRDGSSRGDYVTRELYRIAESGFQNIFYDQLEEEYHYLSPCPAAVDPPSHTAFSYLTPEGGQFPTQVKLIHTEFELIASQHKQDNGDCPESENFKAVSHTEEIIDLCE